MMRDDSRAILDDVLSRWHFHCKHYSPVPVAGADPMFRQAISSKGWDETSDIADDATNRAQMEAMDFIVTGDKQGQGGMQEPHKSAIYMLARNCYTGRSVWLSPRLPTNPEERALIILEARNELTRKLMRAGVL